MLLSAEQFHAAVTFALRDALGADHGLLDYGSSLEDAGFDSLRMSNFVLAFEEAAKFEMPAACIDRLWEATTLGEVRDVLAEHCAETANGKARRDRW